MKILEQILEEIKSRAQELSENHWGDDERHLIGKGIQCMCVQTEDIIRSHMEDSTGEFINIEDERFWNILFEEACVEDAQAERILKRLKEICISHTEDDGWIPVTERLPEVGIYLVTCDDEKYPVKVMRFKESEDTLLWYTSRGIYDGRIYAWMPLPEPCHT